MSTDVLQKPEKETPQLSAGRIEELIAEHASSTEGKTQEQAKQELENPGKEDQETWNRFANGEPAKQENEGALNEILPQPENVDPTTKQLGETAVEATTQHLNQAS
ncbi:MAG: hypothetical protein H6793_01270 [Candidatus Nomurabacteria bacterium]|nr:MAG: hypothetical protein H6793_01270 [Candidatus Nomurabacteria bacterium]